MQYCKYGWTREKYSVRKADLWKQKLDLEITPKDLLLEELGLSKVSDRLSLKGFCTKEVESFNDKEKQHSREQKRSYLKAFYLRKKVKKSPLQGSTLVHGKAGKIQVK